jgi:hypothetical protein
MNITSQRTLVVCVLAGALALALVLVASRDASAAPPEPINDAFTVRGVCDFPVRLQVSGKAKVIELPGERLIGISPGVRITAINIREPAHRVTYVTTGAAHITDLPSGAFTFVATGRNLLFDTSFGMLLTMGRFTFVIDPEEGIVSPLRGKGRVIDVCQRLA